MKGGLNIVRTNTDLYEILEEILRIPSNGTHIEIDCNGDTVPTISWTIDGYPITIDK